VHRTEIALTSLPAGEAASGEYVMPTQLWLEGWPKSERSGSLRQSQVGAEHRPEAGFAGREA